MTQVIRRETKGAVRLLAAAALICLVAALPSLAQNKNAGDCATPQATDDWCFSQISRVEDTSSDLTCQIGVPPFQVTVTERVWFDAPDDGVVNDLATFAIAPDTDGMYLFAELWVDPDPLSLPHGQVAIDVAPGGNQTWFDPAGNISVPGFCQNDPNISCSVDADCNYCEFSRKACGSACDPIDDGSCINLGDTCVLPGTSVTGNGVGSGPSTGAEFMIIFDFALWLQGADFALVTWDNAGTWTALPNPANAPSEPGYPGCVDPGQSGGSSGPPGKVEIFIPWTAFDCGGAGCASIGPASDINFQLLIARDDAAGDYSPAGAVEDVFSEPSPGAETRTGDACATPADIIYPFCNTPGTCSPRVAPASSTRCEIADQTIDGYILPGAQPPGGRIDGLLLGKSGAQVDMNWNPSCSSGDNDYELYTGTIGSWYSHDQTDCSTGGTSTTITPGGGSEYYLIVPTDGSTEGSYGERNDTSTERPAGTTVCNSHSLGSCP